MVRVFGRRLGWIIPAVVALGVFAGAPGARCATGPAAEPTKEKPAPVELIKPGTAAAPFRLLDLEGKSVELASYSGKKVVLLAFWSFFCGPCRTEMPLLDQLAKKYAPEGLEMLAITTDADGKRLEKPIRMYLSSNNFSYRVLWDVVQGNKRLTADAYGVSGTPTMILVGKDGKVAWAHVGAAPAEKVEAEIKNALAAGS